MTAHAFWIGSLGALLYEASRWIGLRYERKLPAYMYRLHYWLLTLIFIAMGGTLAYFLNPETTVQGLCIGIAAPSIISRLERLTPEQPKLGTADRKHEETSFREWLAS